MYTGSNMVDDKPEKTMNPFRLAGLKLPATLGCAAAVLVAAFSLFMPNYYKSEVRILPVEAKGAGGFSQFATAAMALGLGGAGQEGLDGNYVDILNSRWVRENLLRQEFSFHVRSWRFGAEKAKNCTLIEYLGVENMDRGVGAVGAMVSASRDLKSKLISISVETKSPELSQAIAKKASALLESFVLQKARTRGGNKAQFAELRLKDAQAEMETVEAEFRRFINSNRNYQASSDPIIRLEGARMESRLKLREQVVVSLSLNREQALMEEKNDLPILNVLDAGNLPIDKSRPARSVLVVLSFLLVTGGAWIWLNRASLKSRLLESEN